MRISDELENAGASFLWGGIAVAAGQSVLYSEFTVENFLLGSTLGVTAYAVGRVVHPLFTKVLGQYLSEKNIFFLTVVVSLLSGTALSATAFGLTARKCCWLGAGVLGFFFFDILFEPFPVLSLYSYLKA